MLVKSEYRHRNGKTKRETLHFGTGRGEGWGCILRAMPRGSGETGPFLCSASCHGIAARAGLEKQRTTSVCFLTVDRRAANDQRRSSLLPETQLDNRDARLVV